MRAKQSPPRLQFILSKDVWWKVCGEESVYSQESRGVRTEAGLVLLIVQLKGNTDFASEPTWRIWGPSLLTTVESETVDFATALTHMAVFISSTPSRHGRGTAWARLRVRLLKHPCKLTRNPTSQQSLADSRQYKTTTMKHQSIHQLLRKIQKNRKSRTTAWFLLFRLF